MTEGKKFRSTMKYGFPIIKRKTALNSQQVMDEISQSDLNQ